MAGMGVNQHHGQGGFLTPTDMSAALMALAPRFYASLDTEGRALIADIGVALVQLDDGSRVRWDDVPAAEWARRCEGDDAAAIRRWQRVLTAGAGRAGASDLLAMLRAEPQLDLLDAVTRLATK